MWSGLWPFYKNGGRNRERKTESRKSNAESNILPMITTANFYRKCGLLAVCLVVASPLLLSGAPMGHDVLVGINYFAGWWEPLPNKWHGHGWTTNEPDWRPGNPARVPVLGEYNDQATMDREIAAAAGHGVDFFSILWYFGLPGSKPEQTAPWLNRGLENFIHSTNASRLQFMIEFCNHAEFSPTNDAQWESCMQAWLPALRHPSYLRVGGRLVFKVHDAAGFFQKNGGELERARARLEALRRTVREAGLGEMLIGGGIMSRSQIKSGGPAAKLFDFTATYMSIPPVEILDNEYPYPALDQEAREARAQHANDPIPWVPYIAAGWNPRPWTHPKADPNHRRFFTFPTRSEWSAALKSVRDDFAKYPKLGLPLPDGRRQKVFTIYAWNEFGEGGIVAPTQADQAMKLETIAEVFGR